tara:strand:+ start:28629 stop:28823 length:195 start_codon:yes stop_codon:yes gene_type:complete
LGYEPELGISGVIMNSLQRIQLEKYNGAIKIYKQVNKKSPPKELRNKWANMLSVAHLLRRSNAS